MITNYAKIYDDINSLIDFLSNLGIDASLKSHLENDFLVATDFLEKYQKGHHNELTEEGRSAVGGLHELYKWIWSIKDRPEFDSLKPHLGMLSESATRISTATSMLSPVTGKQDDKSNKLIETIVAMFAVKIGSNIDLDDPIASSNGKNPDIIFNYSGKRIAIACKTIRGSSMNTLLDNFRSAAKQINRAKCDFGYIAINAMNILPHDAIRDNVYPDLSEPLQLLTSNIHELYNSLKTNSVQEIHEIFSNKKIRPVILTFVHSTTKLQSPVGFVLTMIKATFASPLLDDSSNSFDMELLEKVNDFIHHRL